MLPPIANFFDRKKVLREHLRGERRAAAKARPEAAVHAARNFMAAIDIPEGGVIALYYPIKNELDTGPLRDALLEQGASLALPVIVKRKAPLIFRRYEDGEALMDGPYGAKTPRENAPLVRPAIIVAPLLGFTRAGARLGYGGGYYDRTLADLRKTGEATAVGYAYAAQEVDALPLSPLDQHLDWIVTEAGAIRC
jgi:5-formyltetrahydrofolate cyclo-ligase